MEGNLHIRRTDRIHGRRLSESPVPLVHRWVILSGLGLWLLWLVCSPVAMVLHRGAPITQDPLVLGINLLWPLGVLFVAFGLLCELVLAMASSAHDRKKEGERLDELSGRVRFRRPKHRMKVAPPLPVGWNSLTELGTISPLPRRRTRRSRKASRGPESW